MAWVERWSFQHVQELFPTCRLARGPGAPLSLPRAERPVLERQVLSAVQSIASWLVGEP
jgi:hypothetical protein